MTKLREVPRLDKKDLIKRIRENFLDIEDYMYERRLFEFIKDGDYIGDNFFETVFKLNPNKPPIVYEITGPYDSKSKNYAAIARMYYMGELQLEFDHKKGIGQRTAAMCMLYLQELKHKPRSVLLIGPGKINIMVAEYLKYFHPEIDSVDYVHYEKSKPEFEKKLRQLKIDATFVKNPKFEEYDTVILATTTKDYCITKEDIDKFSDNSLIISLGTSSAVGEIEPSVYGMDDVQVFLDYEDSKTFTNEMKQANEKGYLENTVLLKSILEGLPYEDDSRVKLLRLTGTPMQNIAVIEMMKERV